MASFPDAAPLRGAGALITGGSRGIGYEIARSLVQAGALVTIVARNADLLAQAAAALGANATPRTADVADADAVDKMADWFAREHAGSVPDIIVNAAGAFQLAPIAQTGLEAFDRMIAANLRAPFLLMRRFLPAMLERGSGHFVTIGSIAGRQAFAHNGAYAASKFGVRGLHAVLDQELRGTGVRATLVDPGATDTPLWDGPLQQQSPGLPERAQMLHAADVADAVLFALTRPQRVDVRNIFLERS